METPESKTELPSCCQPVKRPEGRKGLFWGVVYGLLPHVFCIAFMVLSVVGATAGAAFFGKFLAMPFFFPALIALSFVFATISAIMYLKRGGNLSIVGVKRSKKYLGILYAATLAVGLVFAYVVFPLAIQKTNPSQNAAQSQIASSMLIKVDIPCPGHAPLIIGELKKINGVLYVEFVSPNSFKIGYDQEATSPLAIMSLEIFKTYKATIQ
jgi:hypothetical protein